MKKILIGSVSMIVAFRTLLIILSVMHDNTNDNHICKIIRANQEQTEIELNMIEDFTQSISTGIINLFKEI